MAQFPIQYSEATPSGRSPNVRASINTDTGGQELAQGIKQLGAGIGQIEQDIRKAQDASELSTIDRQLAENWNAEFTTLQDTPDPNERIKLHQKAIQDRQTIITSSKRPNVINAAKLRLDTAEPQYAAHFNALDRTEKIRAMEDSLNLDIASGILATDYPRVEKSIGLAVGTKLISEDKAKLMLLKAKTDIGIQQVHNQVATLKGLGKFDEAVKLVQSSTALDAEKQQAMLQSIEAARNQSISSVKAIQEQTGRQALADVWDKKITDPNEITKLLRENKLNDTDAKELRKLIVNPEPVTTNNESYVKVKEANLKAVDGLITKQDALSVLTANSSSINPTDGKSLINELYSDISKDETADQKSAMKYIDDVMLQSDIFGRYFGDSTQFKNAAEAKVILDANIKKVKTQYGDKPVPSGVYLQEAYKITQMDRFKDSTLIGGKMTEKAPTGLETIWPKMNSQEKQTATKLLTIVNPKTGKLFTADEIAGTMNVK